VDALPKYEQFHGGLSAGAVINLHGESVTTTAGSSGES